MEPDRTSDPRRTAEETRSRAVFEARDASALSSTGRGKARGEAHRLLSVERMVRLRALVEREMPARPWPDILDVGCGGGNDLGSWLEAGWPPERLAGVDLVPRRVQQARNLCPGADIREGSGASLPFPDGRFDMATASTVLSSILDREVRGRVLAEMFRVVRRGGLVVVYDFVVKNPRNADVVAMPLSRLAEVAGRAPDGSERLSPLVYLVAAGAAINQASARVAWALGPRTHRLTFWRVR